MASTKKVTRKTNTKKPKAGECLLEGCDRKATTRGLCPACYQQAYNYFRGDEKREKELVDNGLILPRRSARIASGTSPFQKNLAKVKKK